MDFRFSQFEILTACGSIFLCLLLVCVFNEASGIEEDLAMRVSGDLQQPERNLFWVGVDAQGQNIVLRGAALDMPARHQAGTVARQTWGVGEVTNRIAVVGEAGACQRPIDELLQAQPVLFRAGRAELADVSFAVLSSVADVVRDCGARLEIATHTDAKGDSEINQRLSQRRADAVRKRLVQNGIAAEHLEAVGYGETQPIADNDSSEGRKANRRVEFRVLGGTV